MKTAKILLAVVAILLGTASASAEGMFKFGPKVGLTVNSMHFDKSVLDANNKTGWTAGVMTEFRVPVIGVGVDLSLMYVRRNTQFCIQNDVTRDGRDYFEIPLNLRYNFGLPVVGKFLTPYVAVGPSVAFLTSRKTIEDAYRNKSVDWAMNFGFGVQLINHIDINARYGLGLTKAVNTVSDFSGPAAGIQGKNRYWTISVAYLF